MGSAMITRTPAARMSSTSRATYAADGGTPGFSSTVAAIVRPKRRAKYGHVSCAVTTRVPANGRSVASHRGSAASSRATNRARLSTNTVRPDGASVASASTIRSVIGRAFAGSSQ